MGAGSGPWRWRAEKGLNGRGQHVCVGPKQARGLSPYVVRVQDHQLGPVVFHLVAALGLHSLQGAFLRPAWQLDAVQEGGLASFPGVGVRLLQGGAWGAANTVGGWLAALSHKADSQPRVAVGGRENRPARGVAPSAHGHRCGASRGKGPVSKAGKTEMKLSVGSHFSPFICLSVSDSFTRVLACEGSEARGICVTGRQQRPPFPFTRQWDPGAKQTSRGRAGRAFEAQQTDARPGVLPPSSSPRPGGRETRCSGQRAGAPPDLGQGLVLHFPGQVT